MKFIEYDNFDLIGFYIQNGLEFDNDKGYFGDKIRSFALMENNKIIGVVSISKYKNKSFIEALAVDSDCRNKQMGKALLKKAIEELETPIYTISKVDEFYIKCGFDYDNDADLIGEKCKNCKEYNVNCFPKVVVYK